MMRHPDTVVGLADGGAHCSMICDASMPTFLLQHWVRDRSRGPRLLGELRFVAAVVPPVPSDDDFPLQINAELGQPPEVLDRR